MLLSLGAQGVVLDLAKILSGSSFAYGSPTEERIGWAGTNVLLTLAALICLYSMHYGISTWVASAFMCLIIFTSMRLGSDTQGFCIIQSFCRA
jgi:hypothetical protein